MTEQPNIVLVTVDSLRADHCTHMGYTEETTPAIDDIAATGATFTGAVAPGPSTPESMPAIFTGQYPNETVDPTDVSEARARITRHMTARETLPERLSRRGYATAGFTPNPYTSRYFGFDAGFDYFQDFSDGSIRTAGGGVLQRLSPSSDAAQAVRMFVNLVRSEEVFKPWEAYVDEVAAWMDSASSPYFAWIHMMDPHVPYLAPRPYRQLNWWQTFRANVAFWRGDKEAGLDAELLDRLRTAYDDTVRYADAFIDRLQSMTDGNTSILVHGDHGEAFGEHGTYGHEPYLYEENIHVPLVVSGVPSTTVRSPVSLRSIPSLVADLADGEWDPRAASRSFAMSRTAGSERVAIRGSRLKYIRSSTAAELYDLAQDEQTQLTDGDLRATCQAHLERFDAGMTESRTVRTAAERLAEGSA